MKNWATLILLSVVFFYGCSNDDEETAPETTPVSVSIRSLWDDLDVTTADLDDIKYTNAHGEMMSINRLRFLISDLRLRNTEGEEFLLSDYHLYSITDLESAFSQTGVEVPLGTYEVLFTFGFRAEDNIDGAYPDLNLANWNVPEMLGGGYHYMQLEGEYINDAAEVTAYQFHTIQAADMSSGSLVLTDTSFEVSLGSWTIDDDQAGGSLVILADISEWFENPVEWNLNELYTMLMPNYDAQLMMAQNGRSVFRRGEPFILNND